MLKYNLEELAAIYDTLEFLKNTYNITVHSIQNKTVLTDVKQLINHEILKLLQKTTNLQEIIVLKKYILN